ncbi:MAG: hypothetical protein Q8N99_07285 [Nanoarchaeota archaeon]|nr:hypothetical protein [Nanoarchaeota archaeon]
MELVNIVSIVLVVIILIVVILYLIYANRKLTEKIRTAKQRINYYKERLANIEYDNRAQKGVEELDKIARDFLKEKLDLDYNLTYKELKEKFKKESKAKYSEFCKFMSELMYSDNRVDILKLKKAINILQDIIEDWDIKL